MSRVTLIVLTSAFVCTAASAVAENSVVVESREFYVGQSLCSVGVFITNAIYLTSLAIPLEARSVSGGAYMAPIESFKFEIQPLNRLHCSPLGPWTGCPFQSSPSGSVSSIESPIPSHYSCSGPSANTYHTMGACCIDFVSPDGFYVAAVSTGGDITHEDSDLNPGADLPGTNSASALITFAANDSAGFFVIDTVCWWPPMHLYFSDIFGGSGSMVTPAFTPGTITLSECLCQCHGDPNCNGTFADMLDVVQVIDVAFRTVAALHDPCPSCWTNRMDVNCDHVTDIIDVIKFIDVAFRGASPSMAFCPVP